MKFSKQCLGVHSSHTKALLDERKEYFPEGGPYSGSNWTEIQQRIVLSTISVCYEEVTQGCYNNTFRTRMMCSSSSTTVFRTFILRGLRGVAILLSVSADIDNWSVSDMNATGNHFHIARPLSNPSLGLPTVALTQGQDMMSS